MQTGPRIIKSQPETVIIPNIAPMEGRDEMLRSAWAGPKWGASRAPARHAITAPPAESRAPRRPLYPSPPLSCSSAGEGSLAADVFGDMKYSYPLLLSGSAAYFSFYRFCIYFYDTCERPAQREGWMEECRKKRFPGMRGEGDAKIRGACRRNRGLLLI